MPQPTTIKHHRQSKILEIEFDDGQHFNFTCEYLRVFSPSAEVRGHGVGSGVLQLNKQNVNITEIEPVGNYAIKLTFDDGHNTGIYSWNYLYELGINQDKNWREYLLKIENVK